MSESLSDSNLDTLFVEGYAPFVVGENTYETYYRIAGDLKTSTQTPLVLLHGGAGLDCQYLPAHVDLTLNHNIPIILYDQLGGGKSTHLPHKTAEFWTLDLFCDQLEQLLNFFNISERYHLYGHSFGGIISAHYIANREHRGLNRLVLVGTPASIKIGEIGLDTLIAKFPEKLQESLHKQERGEEYDKDDIKEAEMLFLKRHICRLDPTPECLIKVLMENAKDPTVSHYMMGDLPFKTIGTMKDMSIIDYLHKIDVATLIINGEYDMSQDICTKPLFEHIPKAKWIHFMGCSHMPFLEARHRYMQLLGDFLADA